jgi:hypothetical protein
MNTRLALLLLPLLIAGLPLRAQTKPAVRPPQLDALRDEHVREVERVTAPLKLEYPRQLGQLKAQLTANQKTKEALAVDAELRQQPPVPPEPTELVKLRNEHNAKVRNAVAPLNASYVRKLDALKQQFTREQKLELALLVSREMELVQRNFLQNDLVLISVIYGVAGSSKFADLVDQLVGVLRSGQPTARLTFHPRGIFSIDPSPQQKEADQDRLFLPRLSARENLPRGLRTQLPRRSPIAPPALPIS